MFSDLYEYEYLFGDESGIFLIQPSSWEVSLFFLFFFSKLFE